MSRKLSEEVRRQILDAAGSAFYERGFQAVGVDAVAEYADVSKMTVYRYFASKDDLIVAVLARANLQGTSFIAELMAKPKTPRAKLLAVFTWIAERASSPECSGCMFQSSAAEFAEHDHSVHQAGLLNKVVTRATYLEQAQLMKARNPEMLADQLLLLTDGAWAAARMWGPDNPSRSLVAAAKVLIDAQMRGSS
jgi:AcrR family transcriptional regulator